MIKEIKKKKISGGLMISLFLSAAFSAPLRFFHPPFLPQQHLFREEIIREDPTNCVAFFSRRKERNSGGELGVLTFRALFAPTRARARGPLLKVRRAQDRRIVAVVVVVSLQLLS